MTRFTSVSTTQQLLLYGSGRDATNNADLVIDGQCMANPQLITDL